MALKGTKPIDATGPERGRRVEGTEAEALQRAAVLQAGASKRQWQFACKAVGPASFQQNNTPFFSTGDRVLKAVSVSFLLSTFESQGRSTPRPSDPSGTHRPAGRTGSMQNRSRRCLTCVGLGMLACGWHLVIVLMLARATPCRVEPRRKMPGKRPRSRPHPRHGQP